MHDAPAFAREVVVQVRQFVDKRDDALRRELVALRDRLAELEDHLTRPGPRP
ncbi:MAG: hypothetical protein ACRYG4_09220 [Janthinobacterium lividum]